ncbi:hypothetical protein B7486_00400 [cyanobacterium TDX16]|nr:hypothetical protein B7486_00400 [cyanobacterium TDX16]
MSERGEARLEPESDALICPNCDYNLTGLTRNLCPECGREFDPAGLRKAQQGIPRPIGAGELLKRVCLPMPFGFCALLIILDDPFLMLLLVPVVLIVPFWCGMTAYSCAERLAVNLSIRRGRPRQEWRHHMGVVWIFTAILLCVQLLGAAAIAAACISYAFRRGGFH